MEKVECSSEKAQQGLRLMRLTARSKFAHPLNLVHRLTKRRRVFFASTFGQRKHLSPLEMLS
jgi:hypothetical protein